jgi:hypothetical protein
VGHFFDAVKERRRGLRRRLWRTKKEPREAVTTEPLWIALGLQLFGLRGWYRCHLCRRYDECGLCCRGAAV